MTFWGWLLLAYVATVTIPLALIDIRQHRLPNKLVLPGIALAVTLGLAQVLAEGEPTSLICGAVWFALFLVFALVGGMGMGDVKLAAVLGAASGFLGWQVALAALMSAFVLGGLGAVIQRVSTRLRHKPRTSHIPFGPYMLAGFWVCAALALVRA